MGHLKVGDMFGEQSALNDIPNPYTIVAASPKVEYYRIHRSNYNYIMDKAGDTDSVNEMRAQVILENNWYCSKILKMEMMDVSELWKLEFCNDLDLNKNKPTKTTIKEASFMSTDPL
jgi:hypothetical protein